MEGVISFLAVAGMFSPLQLAEEPLYGEPPVILEGDIFNATVLGVGFDKEIGNAVNVNLFIHPSGWEARTHIVGFGINCSEVANVLQNDAVIRLWAGFTFVGSLDGVGGG